MSEASCKQHNSPDIAGVSVNGVLIDADQIAKELQYHPAESAEQAAHKATEALVIKQLLLQKALSLGISGESQQQDDDETVDEAAIRLVLQQEISAPSASDEESQQYYQANQSKFKSAPLMEVSHILLAADPQDFEARQAVRARAEELIKQLAQSPAAFAQLARELSSCPSKEEGGSLGQISKGQTTPEFERQVFLLDEGLCLSPIESRYGCHIVNVKRKVDGEQKSFEDSKNHIKQYLQDQSYVRAVSQYISILMSEAEIQGYDADVPATPLVQ
jgi:peptidyl-prolyl cis-trans isomerase C